MTNQSNPIEPDRLSNKDLKAILNSNVDQEELTRLLFFFTLEQTRKSNPRLAEIMMACAIPRRLDSETIGILRGHPEEEEVNKQLLASLKSFSFVQARTDDSYVYHDNTRDVILRVWESDDYQQQYNQIKEKLEESSKASNQEHYSKRKPLPSKDGATYFWRGYKHWESKNYLGALNDLSIAIELGPEDGNSYAWRGVVNHELQDYQAALTDLTKAIELQPDKWLNYHWRAYVHHGLKDYPAALADFSKAIELKPDKWLNYYWKGRLIHHELRDYAEAIIDYNKALELSPDNSDIHAWRGRAYYALEQYPKALLDFSKAIELRPEEGINYYWRGLIYYGMEDNQAASSDFTKAVTYLSKDIDNYPEVDFNYYWRARAYYELKDYPSALADLNKSIELADDNATFDYYWRGRVHYELNDLPAARADFSKALELEPQESLSFFEEIVPYYHSELYPDAMGEFINMFNNKTKGITE